VPEQANTDVMDFEIFPWNASFATGIALIDDQHHGRQRLPVDCLKSAAVRDLAQWVASPRGMEDHGESQRLTYSP
jgi:hypothetical protein